MVEYAYARAVIFERAERASQLPDGMVEWEAVRSGVRTTQPILRSGRERRLGLVLAETTDV